jgi:uncharacterized membrane protein YqjE
MGYQTTMNGLRFRHKSDGILQSLEGLGGDVASLVELQAKLAAYDFKDAVNKAAVPSTTLIVSTAVLMASLPVVLIGLGFALASMGIAQWAAFLITGVVFATVAGVIAWFSLVRFLKSFESFRRSREELVRNINWLRTVALQSGRPVDRPTH